MRFKDIISVGTILSMGMFTACKKDPNQTKLQYFPDMADSPAIKTQGNYLDPPEGSISRTAILYPETSAESEKLLHNPIQGANIDQHLENGERLFGIYCSICHGQTGKGDGNITDLFPRPPDLSTDMYRKRGDGFFFHVITFGGAVMPKYGDKIPAMERWEIVHHIRHLQKLAEAPADPASTKAEGTVK